MSRFVPGYTIVAWIMVALLTVPAVVAATDGDKPTPPAGRSSRPVSLPRELLNAATSGTARPGWFRRRGRAHDLSDLPAGGQTLAGVRWLLTDRAVMLAGSGSTVRSRAVKGIPVDRRADVVHFLHTYNPGPALEAWEAEAIRARAGGRKSPDPPVLFHYALNYADGVSVRLAVRWGESIEDWIRAGEYADPPFAQTAWSEQLHHRWVHDRWPRSGERLVLYAMRFDNPRPGQTIASIDLIGANDAEHDWGAPALLAVSTSRREYPGTTYYVAPDGEDGGPGTFEKPWATLHKAAESLKAGDTVYVRGGRYMMPGDWQALIMPRNAGTEERPITYAGYPGETAVIDGRNHHCAHDTRVPHAIYDRDRGMFQIEEMAYITVKNLHLENSRKSGFGVYASDHVTLSHNYVYGTFHCGINSAANTRFDMIGNTLGQVCSSLYSWDPATQEWDLGDDWTNPYRGPGALEWGQWPRELRHLRKPGREAIDNHRNEHVEIAFNEIYWCSKEGISDPQRHFKIHHNYVHHFLGPHHSAGIYLDAYGPVMDDLDVYANVIHHTATGIAIGSEGGTLGDDIRIHHNLCFDNWWTGILNLSAGQDGPRRNMRIESNTVHHNGHSSWEGNPTGGIHLGSINCRDITVRHNICTDNRDYQVAMMGRHNRLEQSIAIERNFCSPLIGPLERDLPKLHRWYPVVGDHTLTGDPLYVDPIAWDFRLQADSPGIDAGLPEERFVDPDGTLADLGAFPYHHGELPIPEPGKGFVLRINCGSDSDYTDSRGRLWHADRRHREGSWGATWSSTVERPQRPVADTSDPAIYLTERYGMEEYRIPVPKGIYRIRLHFAETYVDEPGERVFTVSINRRRALEEFDPLAAAGGEPFTAVVREFETRVYDGEIRVSFLPRRQNPIVNGIEVIQITRGARADN